MPFFTNIKNWVYEHNLLLLVGALFLLLAAASSATRAPWCDEAYFAEPAFQIDHIGRMATLVDPPSPVDDPRTVGTDRFIFWTLPLDIVLQAAWYRVAGFGMIQMRLLAALWGLVAIAAWWSILTSVGAGKYLRLAATAFIALDYSFIRSGSEGRMDMMSAALGFCGIAVFLRLQERHYLRAILAGSACAAASAFTHPVGGMLATSALGLTIVWYSAGRFRWWHPALAAVPYMLFAGGWGIYILQAPDLFQKQLLSVSGDRLNAWAHPLRAIASEVSARWSGVFGLTSGTGLKRIRALVLIAYAIGLVTAILRFKRLVRPGYRLLVAICLADLVILCLADSTKSAAYLVHVLPFMGALLAILVVDHWRPFGAMAFASVLTIQLLGTVYIISRLEYQKEYLPAIQVLQENGGQVTGEAQLGFGLGFTNKLTDDHRLGYYTGSKSSLFVMNASYEVFGENYRTSHPEIYSFINEKVARSRLIFQNSIYKIYVDGNPVTSASTR